MEHEADFLMKIVTFLLLSFLFALGGWAQSAPATPAPAADDISGMYAFLREGEFVQITVEAPAPVMPPPAPADRLSSHRVEDHGNVSGYISRLGDSSSDQGAVLDHFFKKGTLDGKKLTFVTQSVHGVVYEFTGTVELTPNKAPGEEGYRVLKGTLTVTTTDADKKTSTRSREVELKSFPREAVQ